MKNPVINWVKPKLSNEIEEYTGNEHTQKFFQKKGLLFKSDEEVLDFLKTGKATTVTQAQLSARYVNMTLDPKEFKTELADPDYSLSFRGMDKILQDKGEITLPMPIIINFDGLYYGYAGNRRMNLAFKYDIPLKAWLIEVGPKKSSLSEILKDIVHKVAGHE
jgi:hypothetical protein